MKKPSIFSTDSTDPSMLNMNKRYQWMAFLSTVLLFLLRLLHPMWRILTIIVIAKTRRFHTTVPSKESWGLVPAKRVSIGHMNLWACCWGARVGRSALPLNKILGDLIVTLTTCRQECASHSNLSAPCKSNVYLAALKNIFRLSFHCSLKRQKPMRKIINLKYRFKRTTPCFSAGPGFARKRNLSAISNPPCQGPS